MPTWEEGQEEAQRQSRNRAFGGTRSLGGATGETRDLSGTPQERKPSIFANLRGGGAQGAPGAQPNYGMGASRYPASQFSANVTQNGTGSVAGSSGSRGMRRGGGASGITDTSHSGNVNITFGNQDSRSGSIGNVAGAGATQDNRQDNSFNVDMSSRNLEGGVGSSLTQDASGGAGGKGGNSGAAAGGAGGAGAGGGAGGAGAASATKVTTPRGPTKAEQKHRAENPNWKPEDGIPKDPVTGKPKWGRGSGTARGTGGAGGKGGAGGAGGAGGSTGNGGGAAGGRGGENTGTVGDTNVDMSSGRRGSVLDGPPGGGGNPGNVSDSPTDVSTGNTGANTQQYGDNTTYNAPAKRTSIGGSRRGGAPASDTGTGEDVPPSVGESPRSTGRPTPDGGSPDRPVGDVSEEAPPAPARSGRLRGWLESTGRKDTPTPVKPGEVEGLSKRLVPGGTSDEPTGRIPTPTPTDKYPAVSDTSEEDFNPFESFIDPKKYPLPSEKPGVEETPSEPAPVPAKTEEMAKTEEAPASAKKGRSAKGADSKEDKPKSPRKTAKPKTEAEEKPAEKPGVEETPVAPPKADQPKGEVKIVDGVPTWVPDK